MRTVSETNEEFGHMDQNGQVNYIWENYRGAYDFSYDVNTFLLTIQLAWVEEAGRTDLLPINEPEIVLALIKGIYTAQYIFENYHDTYLKDSYYPDATCHSLSYVSEPPGLLRVYFD